MNQDICAVRQANRLLTRLSVTRVCQGFARILALHSQTNRWDHVMDWRRADLEFLTVQHVRHLGFRQTIKTYRKEIGPFCPTVESHQILKTIHGVVQPVDVEWLRASK